MGRTSSTSSSKGNDDKKPAAKLPVTRSVRGTASLKSPPTPGTEGFMPSRSPIAIRYSPPGGRSVAVQMTRETSLQAAASRGRSHEVHDSPIHLNSNVTTPNTGRDITMLFGSPDPSSLQATSSRHDSANSNSNVTSDTGRNISTLFGSPDPTQRRSNSATPIVSPSENANGNTCLAQYGFAATARRTYMASNTTKCHYLKLAIIKGPGPPDVYHFIFRCEHFKGPRIGAWHEKLFMDEMVRRAPWIEDLNFVEVLKWHENGVEVKNERNFTVRLFRMEVRSPDPPLRERLLQLGEDICKLLNELVQHDRPKIVAHPDKYFWFGFEHRTVWFDVWAEYDVVKLLLRETGLPTDKPGFFDINRDQINCCFRPGTLSLAVARGLHGRMTDVHENERVIDFEGEVADYYQAADAVEHETFDSGADLDETPAHTEGKND